MPLAFFRALLPSWRFFDRATHPPRLFVRVADGDWAPFDPGPRSPLAPLFAPAANLSLAYASIVQRFVQELGDLELDGDVDSDGIERDPRITSLVSYALVTRIACTNVPPGAPFQWKIVVHDNATPSDYIVSPPIGADAA